MKNSTANIVERLRELVASIHQLGARPGGEPIDVMAEAADEIERLRAALQKIVATKDSPYSGDAESAMSRAIAQRALTGRETDPT
jgi:uncharacterized protein YjlB